MKYAIAVLLPLVLVGCSPSDNGSGDSQKELTLSLESYISDEEVTEFTVTESFMDSLSSGLHSVRYTPADAEIEIDSGSDLVDARLVSGELVFQKKSDITTDFVMPVKITARYGGKVEVVEVIVNIEAERKAFLISEPASNVVELTDFETVSSGYDLVLEPTNKPSIFNVSIQEDPNYVGGASISNVRPAIIDGELFIRRGQSSNYGSDGFIISISVWSGITNETLSLPVVVNVVESDSPSIVKKSEFLLANSLTEEVSASTSTLLDFYLELAYLNQSINYSQKSNIIDQCKNSQAQAIQTLNSAWTTLDDAFSDVMRGYDSPETLAQENTAYVSVAETVLSGTVSCVNDVITQYLPNTINQLPSSYIQEGETDFTLFRGGSSYGYQNGSVFEFYADWAFLADLGY